MEEVPVRPCNKLDKSQGGDNCLFLNMFLPQMLSERHFGVTHLSSSDIVVHKPAISFSCCVKKADSRIYRSRDEGG